MISCKSPGRYPPSLSALNLINTDPKYPKRLETLKILAKYSNSFEYEQYYFSCLYRWRKTICFNNYSYVAVPSHAEDPFFLLRPDEPKILDVFGRVIIFQLNPLVDF